MQLQFKFLGRFYDISIGYDTPWFSQVWFISVSEIWYDNKDVVYAELKFHTKAKV